MRSARSVFAVNCAHSRTVRALCGTGCILHCRIFAHQRNKRSLNFKNNRFVLGPVTLALGVLISSLCFNSASAAIGIYALAFGDGLASLAGKLFGITHIPHTDGKTVIGSLTCFTAIFLSSWAVSSSTFTAFVLALAGMSIELLPLHDFDNLIIPVALAAVAQFYFHI